MKPASCSCALFLCAVVMPSCAAPSAQVATSEAPPPVASATTTATVASSATRPSKQVPVDDETGPIGVPECDAYFEAVERCRAKNPRYGAALNDAVDQNRKAWRAAKLAGAHSLNAACGMALDWIEQYCH
jgi:hypothetical protein